ncbi:MAG: hypothetical protein Q9171_002990 [Xanthocarpia ochracea]
MHLINLPLLFAVVSLTTNTVAALGNDHGALIGEPQLELRSPKSRIPNPLPVRSHRFFCTSITIAILTPQTQDYNGINPEGDNPEGNNPEGEHPMGTAPCGTYAIGATDGPCGAWFTAQYSITLSRPPATTFTTTKTTWVTEVASEAAK